jgi:hypothetical protein
VVRRSSSCSLVVAVAGSTTVVRTVPKDASSPTPNPATFSRGRFGTLTLRTVPGGAVSTQPANRAPSVAAVSQ